jgi:hypothetical protein
MTVRINKPALNLREELTKAQSVVPYSQQQFWMDGLVENGTFDTADGWTLGTGWTVGSGVATCDDSQTGYSALTHFISKLDANTEYAITFDVTITVGQLMLRFGSTSSAGNLTPINSSGSYVFTSKPLGGPLGITFLAFASFAGIIDNVAVFEVDENDEVIHSLPLGFKPLHVYEDGLIQREGDVHDYTVVKTGGAYAIKPAVQPTGATETCVIAEREL